MRALTAIFPAQKCRHIGCRCIVERPPLAAGGGTNPSDLHASMRDRTIGQAMVKPG